MRYLLIMLLLSTPCLAAEAVHWKACAGEKCRSYIFTAYYAEDIKALKPDHFCEIDKIAQFKRHTRPDGTTYSDFLAPKMGYVLEKDCKEMDNLAQTDKWPFANPELKDE